MAQTITLGDFGARCESRRSDFRDSLLDGENAIATRKSKL